MTTCPRGCTCSCHTKATIIGAVGPGPGKHSRRAAFYYRSAAEASARIKAYKEEVAKRPK